MKRFALFYLSGLLVGCQLSRPVTNPNEKVDASEIAVIERSPAPSSSTIPSSKPGSPLPSPSVVETARYRLPWLPQHAAFFPDGRGWLANDSALIKIAADGKTTPGPAPFGRISSLVALKDGSILATGESGGATRYYPDGTVAARYDGACLDFCTVLAAVDDSNSVWVTSEFGKLLTKYSYAGDKKLTLAAQPLVGLAAHSAGRLIAASSNRFFEIGPDAEGPTIAETDLEVNTFVLSTSGTIYALMSDESRSLAVIRRGTAPALTKSTGNRNAQILRDSKDRVWLNVTASKNGKVWSRLELVSEQGEHLLSHDIGEDIWTIAADPTGFLWGFGPVTGALPLRGEAVKFKVQ